MFRSVLGTFLPAPFPGPFPSARARAPELAAHPAFHPAFAPSAMPLKARLFLALRPHSGRRPLPAGPFPTSPVPPWPIPSSRCSRLFVLSSGNASREQLKRLAEEASKEGDLLVLANVPEQYRLLAHKTRAWVQFLAKLECPRAPRLLLKLDDDVLVNWPALANLLARTGPKPKRLVLCRTISNGQVTRNPKSKWFLSMAEFRPRPGGLGLYCQGLAILLSWDLLGVAAANLGRVQFLWMDDWYLSHALLAGSNATFVDISPHIHNVDMEEGMARDKAQIGPAVDVHYPPIFGHFRPASFEHKLEEWAKIVGQMPPMEGKRKCAL